MSVAVTAEDMIVTALNKLRIYAPGEQILNADKARGLAALNTMLDSWSNESLSCYAYLTQSHALTPGKQTYTIGPGGDFNMTRPLRIIESPGSVYITDNNGNRYGVRLVVGVPQWGILGNVSNIVTSNFPDTLYYDSQFPLGVMNFFPYPSSSYVATWLSYLQLTDFSALSGAVSLPPGYQKAIEDNLSIELEPFFPQAQLTQAIIAQAGVSKANIKRTNARQMIAYYDAAIVSRANILYNPYTDRVGSTTSGP